MIRSPRRDILGTLLCDTEIRLDPDGNPTPSVVFKVPDSSEPHCPNQAAAKRSKRIARMKELDEFRNRHRNMDYGPFDPFW